jgi:hypothetical protein
MAIFDTLERIIDSFMKKFKKHEFMTLVSYRNSRLDFNNYMNFE